MFGSISGPKRKLAGYFRPTTVFKKMRNTESLANYNLRDLNKWNDNHFRLLVEL